MTPEEQTFVEVFSDSYLASDVAGRFTCRAQKLKR